MSDIRQFNADLEAFSQKIDSDLLIVTRLTALKLLRRIVLKTPRKTGRAKASWNISRETADDSVYPEIPVGAELSAGEAEGIALARQSRLSGLRPGEVVHISNNLDYIQGLEEGRSEQARPAGSIVAISIRETEDEIVAVLA